jgi:hypothetical protein
VIDTGRISDGAPPLPPSFSGPLFWSDKAKNPDESDAYFIADWG